MSFRLRCFCFLFLVLILFPLKVVFSQQPSTIDEQLELLEQANKHHDNTKASLYSLEIGKLYWNERQGEKALKYLDQCITKNKKGGDNVIAYSAYQLSEVIYRENKNFGKALDCGQKALKVSKALKKNEWASQELLNIAFYYGQLNKYKKSIEPLEGALSIAIEENDIDLQQECYEQLSEYYKKLGNNIKSKEYQIHFDQIIESKQNALNEKQLKELEKQAITADEEKKTVSSKLNQQIIKLKKTEDSLSLTQSSLYETQSSLKETESSLHEAKIIGEKRKLQIDLLNKNKELSEMRIKEQSARLETEAWIRNSIIAGIIFTILMIAFIFRGYRKKLEINKKLDQQNKSIKSSINYAKRIQEAMLPKIDLQIGLLPNSFVLFKPRDSVSGDFYWLKEIKNWYDPDVVFAAADCTGHGVPGAFMSMIGINALNGIISQGIAEPNQILEALDTEIRSTLQQDMTGNNDGMDIALCIYRKEKNTVEFSGAKNPLVYIQNKELFQVKGDVHCIGGSHTIKEFSFKKHKILIDQPTMIYLFSDGYRDQFGGKENGKFMSKRFNNLLLQIHQLSMDEQKAVLERTIEEWRGNNPQTDDILVIGVLLDTAVA